ncbi:MAG: hypothetical protein AMXMBFR83_15180 [Phycisphaerae bacterium]
MLSSFEDQSGLFDDARWAVKFFGWASRYGSGKPTGTAVMHPGKADVQRISASARKPGTEHRELSTGRTAVRSEKRDVRKGRGRRLGAAER